MKKSTFNTLRFIVLLISLIGTTAQSYAQHMPHEMQHGFILSNTDTLGSHLVAYGHHSRQVEIVGELTIQDSNELDFYKQRKRQNVLNESYFLFQAQHLDLPSLSAGKVLKGHIVESRVGSYEPNNIVVKSATFQVHRVLLNIPNPFFTEKPQRISSSEYSSIRFTESTNCKYSYPKDGICLVCNGVVMWCKDRF